MCNDEARNVVIFILNANVHVYVHEDLHEIDLYNVIQKISWETTRNQDRLKDNQLTTKTKKNHELYTCTKQTTKYSIYGTYKILKKV
jgi:hypothetical protein